jgi:hypothetical protein
MGNLSNEKNFQAKSNIKSIFLVSLLPLAEFLEIRFSLDTSRVLKSTIRM